MSKDKVVEIRSLRCSKLNFDVVPTSCARWDGILKTKEQLIIMRDNIVDYHPYRAFGGQNRTVYST